MRKAFVFIIRQLVLGVVFYIILGFSASFNFANFDNEDREIIILHGYTSGADSGKLILNPSDDKEPVVAYRKKKVTWSVSDTSNVDLFWIRKKDSSSEIFGRFFGLFGRPPKKYTKKGNGSVKDIHDSTLYNYTIYWKDKKGNGYNYDPKIAIRPTRLVLIEWLIYIGYGISALILSLNLFAQKEIQSSIEKKSIKAPK